MRAPGTGRWDLSSDPVTHAACYLSHHRFALRCFSRPFCLVLRSFSAPEASHRGSRRPRASATSGSGSVPTTYPFSPPVIRFRACVRLTRRDCSAVNSLPRKLLSPLLPSGKAEVGFPIASLFGWFCASNLEAIWLSPSRVILVRALSLTNHSAGLILPDLPLIRAPTWAYLTWH